MGLNVPTPTIPAAFLERLEQIIEKSIGFRFTGARRQELIHKAERAFRASKSNSWEEYLARLQAPQDDGAQRQLTEALTIGETYFFRQPAAFEAIEHEILPQLLAQRQLTRQLRIWCVGCATGEEAYSLAIVVRRLLPARAGWQPTILATDINRSFLARAQAGLYDEWSFRTVDEDFKSTYFTKEGNRFRIRQDLRDHVHFSQLNLVNNTYPSVVNQTIRQDLILCRNVLMYFTPSISAQILERLGNALTPGGWLLLGPSDPTPTRDSGLEVRYAGRRSDGLRGEIILYRRSDAEQPTPTSIPRTPPQASPSIPRTPLPPRSTTSTPSLRGSVPSKIAPRQPLTDTSRKPAPPSSNWQALVDTARASAEHGMLDQAEVDCRKAIAAARMRTEPYYLLGTIKDAQGDALAARDAFRQVLYLDRTHIPAHLALAASYRRSGRLDLAEQTTSQILRLIADRPDNEIIVPDAHLTVRRLRAALGRTSGDDGRRKDEP